MSVQPESGALGFMPFYYQRFAWSTRGWPPEAALAYLFLLCEQYSNGGLNPDPQVLEEIAPGTVAHWDRIKRKFTQCSDGLLRNARCEEFREKALAAGDRRKRQARNAAAMRWQCSSNAGAMLEQCSSNAAAMLIDANDNDNENDIDNEIENQSESKKTETLNGFAVEPVSVQAPKPRRAVIRTEVLEELWGLFPRKVGKRKALTLLDKAVREVMNDFEQDDPADAIEWMREKITAMAQATRTLETKFIPHPATWLHQGRYLDPVEAT